MRYATHEEPHRGWHAFPESMSNSLSCQNIPRQKIRKQSFPWYACVSCAWRPPSDTIESGKAKARGEKTTNHSGPSRKPIGIIHALPHGLLCLLDEESWRRFASTQEDCVRSLASMRHTGSFQRVSCGFLLVQGE
jgi:hypothetical protein